MGSNNPAYSSPIYSLDAITGSQLAALDSNSVARLWKKGVETFDETNDWWKQFEGNDEMSLIQVERDTSKGAGQKITFRVDSGLYQEPHMGEERFLDSSHYEELLLASNDLTVDWFRVGTSYSERTEDAMGMRGELVMRLPEKLGALMGRAKSERVSMMFRDVVPGENKINIAGGLTWNTIVTQSQMLKRWGAPSAKVGKLVNGQPARRYVVVACTDALTSLKLDSDYKDLLRNTKSDLGMDVPFRGGYTDIDGHVVMEYEAIEHDGYGAIGSPMNPMGRLANARTTVSTSAVNLLTMGGSDYDANNTLIKPAKFFPGYDYRVQNNVTLTGDITTACYVAVINPPTAATDPGKWGFYQVAPVTDGSTTKKQNDGVSLCISSALAASATAASGSSFGAAKVVTLGNVTWSSAVNTNNHPIDAMIVEVDLSAIALFSSFIIGAGAARRGYGKYNAARAEAELEGGFAQMRYVKSVFGQSLRSNRRGRVPAIQRLKHRGIYAGFPLPTP